MDIIHKAADINGCYIRLKASTLGKITYYEVSECDRFGHITRKQFYGTNEKKNAVATFNRYIRKAKGGQRV